MNRSTALLIHTVTLLFVAGKTSAAIVHFAPPEPLLANTQNRLLEVDFDANGVVDLEITNSFANLNFLPASANRILANPDEPIVEDISSGAVVEAMLDASLGRWIGSIDLGGGTLVGPEFQSCGSNGAGIFCLGEFLDGEGFFGFEFDIDGQVHYGWARAAGHPIFLRAEIFEWAYESTPGAPIVVGAIPEPTAPTLLLGTIAATLLRRRRCGLCPPLN